MTTCFSERVHRQLTVWFDDAGERGVIVPPVTPCGTVTRRAVERLWLTAANPKVSGRWMLIFVPLTPVSLQEDKVGSELKSLVQAPEGAVFVGADVDSQEQWIAALLGDWVVGVGRVGVTPFSRMMLAGSKEAGTDLHSVVARDVGISRDDAKVSSHPSGYLLRLCAAYSFRC